ncbi:MAG: hypothetical protein ACRDL6_00320 [Solirubrobacterales bacterium]
MLGVPVYAALGVDIFQLQLHWDEVAPTQPADPRNPLDPAYKWNPRFDLTSGDTTRSTSGRRG